MEGLYLRVESEEGKKEGEEEGYLQARAKIVREDFLGTDHNDDVIHWSKKELVKNIVVFA